MISNSGETVHVPPGIVGPGSQCHADDLCAPFTLLNWVLQNHTYDCFWGHLHAHLVVGFPKRISTQLIDSTLFRSQFGDRNH